MSVRSFVIAADDARLDRAIHEALSELSRRQVEALIAAGAVRIDERVCTKKGERPKKGSRVSLDVAALETRAPEERKRLADKERDLRLLAIGDDWAVIRKPAGLGSTPAFFGDALSFTTFSARMLAERWPERATLDDEGLVHRLDVGTSGACLFARTQAALDRFRADRDAGRLRRTYWAIVAARAPEHAVIDTEIAHHPSDPAKMVLATAPHRSKPQPAHTEARVLARDDAAALVTVTIVGGRRHQIRVHMASLGLPLYGDALYGSPIASERLALHATYLDFVCPNAGPQRVAAEPGAHFWAFAPALARPI